VPGRFRYQAVHTGGFLALRTVLNVAVVYVLARTLAPAEFGVFALVKALVTVGVYVLGLELYTYAQRHVPGRPIEEGLAVFMRVFAWEVVLATAIVAAVLASGLDRLLATRLNIAPYADAYRLGFGILLASLVVREAFRFFLAQRMIERSNLVNFVGSNLWAAVVVGLWLAGAPVGLRGALLAWLVGAWVGVAWAALLLARTVGARAVARAFREGLSGVSADFVREVARFTLPVLVTTVALRVVGAADTYLLAALRDAEAVGVYAFYTSLVTLGVILFVLVVSDLLAPYAMAHFNRGTDELGWQLVAKMAKYSVIVYVGLAGGLYVLLDDVLAAIGRPEYAAGRALLVPLLLAGFCNVLFVMANYVLFVRKATRAMAVVAVAGCAINLVANTVLIARLDAQGAAIATALSWGALLGLGALAIGTSGLARLAMGDILRVAAAGAAAVVLAAAVSAGRGGWWAVGGATALVAGYLLALVALRAVSRGDLSALRAGLG
jgi:O-antigen/teichoic acid export membrane protein